MAWYYPEVILSTSAECVELAKRVYGYSDPWDRKMAEGELALRIHVGSREFINGTQANTGLIDHGSKQ